MKTTVSNFVVAVATLCLSGHALFAQTFKYAADVPFSFHTANHTLKPGEYIVERNSSSGVEWLRSVDGAPSLAVTVAPQSLEKSGPARLVFQHVGDDYFLSQIWNSDGKGTIVPRSKAEKLLQERMASNQPETVTVYLASAR